MRRGAERIDAVGDVGWVAVLPVKRLATAKTRLRGAVAGVDHDRLVVAMARDTVAAALACPLVERALVVTDDRAAWERLGGLGAERVPDGEGLNPAFARGAARAGGAPVVALTADLPALRPEDLGAALAALTAPRGYVPDADGTGTAMLAALAGVPLDPRFGPGSAGAHAASGATRLDGDWPGLRRDVDTAADLAAAAALGLGRYTAEVVGAARAGRRARYGGRMQGTVARFDADTGAGAVLLDDGSELAFPAEAFAASGMRLLRVGQRVKLDRDDAGRISRVTLPTFP
jgi:2-phospho-L-lactate guanylyltransferase